MKQALFNEGSDFPGMAPKPFLRWAGGKRKLTDLLIDAIPTKFNPREHRFFEPFVGGGALMLALGNPNAPTFVPGKNLFINDMNPDLVTTYKIIRDEVNELIADLRVMGSDLTKRQFEAVRSMKPRDAAATDCVDSGIGFLHGHAVEDCAY